MCHGQDRSDARLAPPKFAFSAALGKADTVAGAPLRDANALFLSVFERQARDELARLPPEDSVVENVRAEITRGPRAAASRSPTALAPSARARAP